MLHKLNYFFTVANSGSFSKAARKLYVSQSAVSQQISALEHDLNTTLFVRGSQGATLTEGGKELMERISPLIRQMEFGLKDFSVQNEGRASSLLVFHHEAQDEQFIVPLLEKSGEGSCPLELRLKSIAQTRGTFDKVANGNADLRFGKITENTAWPNLRFQKLCDAIPTLLVHPNHRLANLPLVGASDLKSETIIFVDTGSKLTFTHNPWDDETLLSEKARLSGTRTNNIHELTVRDFPSAHMLARAQRGIIYTDSVIAAGSSGLIAIPYADSSPTPYGVYFRKQGATAATQRALTLLAKLFPCNQQPSS